MHDLFALHLFTDKHSISDILHVHVFILSSAHVVSVEVRVHIEKEVQSQSPPLLFNGSRQLSACNSTPVSIIDYDIHAHVTPVHTMMNWCIKCLLSVL